MKKRTSRRKSFLIAQGLPNTARDNKAEEYDERGEACTGYLERYAFYDKAEQACYIVQSGETSQYANVILQKGVVKRNK